MDVSAHGDSPGNVHTLNLFSTDVVDVSILGHVHTLYIGMSGGLVDPHLSLCSGALPYNPDTIVKVPYYRHNIFILLITGISVGCPPWGKMRIYIYVDTHFAPWWTPQNKPQN